jgi:beta-mannosidase
MRHRQKAGDRVRDDGDRRNLRHLIRHFNLPGAQELLDALETPDPKHVTPYCGCEPLHPAKTLPSTVNFDDLHYLLQVNQARALTLGVEWFRSRQPRCMGTLYWQLNDCWPGSTSWSCIDGDGRPKPLWYATRRFFAPSTYTIQPLSPDYRPGKPLALFAINDDDERGAGTTWVRRCNFAGEVLAEQEIDIEWPSRSVTAWNLDPRVTTPDDPSREMMIVGVPADTFWFFLPDKDLAYPQADYTATVSRDGDEYRMTVGAKSLLRDVCVFADRLDPNATVSEQLVTLLPGDGFTFVIKSTRPLTKEQLTLPSVLRCVNPFGASPQR